MKNNSAVPCSSSYWWAYIALKSILSNIKNILRLSDSLGLIKQSSVLSMEPFQSSISEGVFCYLHKNCCMSDGHLVGVM